MIQVKVLTAFASMESGGLYALAGQPDERGHASGHPVTPIGEKAPAVADGATATAVDPFNAGPLQPATGQNIDIS